MEELILYGSKFISALGILFILVAALKKKVTKFSQIGVLIQVWFLIGLNFNLFSYDSLSGVLYFMLAFPLLLYPFFRSFKKSNRPSRGIHRENS